MNGEAMKKLLLVLIISVIYSNFTGVKDILFVKWGLI